ncbi:MAG: hypothetical protein OT477_02845 [Chloroflexi bacterium]|nr:hypothetical protein [Chloroflexota bacterium]
MNEARSWSQAGLYWVTAAVLSTSIFFHLQFKEFRWDVIDWVVVFAALGLLGFMGLGFSSLSSPSASAFWTRRLALVLLVVYALASCAALSVMSVFFLMPQPFLSYGLPMLFLFMCYRYATHLIQVISPTPQPFWAWLVHTNGAGVWIWIFIILGSYTLGSYALVYWDTPPTTLSFPMTWELNATSYCEHDVTLKFVESKGYQIRTCSDSLWNYLEQQPKEEIAMILSRTYAWGVAEYKVETIGGWSGLSTGYNLSWSCHSTEVCSKTPPLGEPYRLR